MTRRGTSRSAGGQNVLSPRTRRRRRQAAQSLKGRSSPAGKHRGPETRENSAGEAPLTDKVCAAAVDQGTTGTRFMIFTHDGNVLATAYQEHVQHYPQPGWVEHDPMEIWEKTQQVIKEALAHGGVPPESISAIGITNQRETTIIWDRRTGRPIYNAIVWQDTRTREVCQKMIDDGFERVVRERTGLVSATYFSGPKLKWLLDHLPGARPHAERGEILFGTVDTWLIWWLTGGPR